MAIDVGASRLIAEGKIKLKNDSQITRFTKTGLEFEDGSTLDADVILFATGYSPASSRTNERGLMDDWIVDMATRAIHTVISLVTLLQIGSSHCGASMPRASAIGYGGIGASRDSTR